MSTENRTYTLRNQLFTDTPTSYRILVNDRPRVVLARHDFNGDFVRFVVHRTPAEINKEQNKYLPARVGIRPTYEVHPWEFRQ